MLSLITDSVHRCSRYLACIGLLSIVTQTVTAQWEPGPDFPAGTDARQYAAGIKVGNLFYAIGGTPWIGGPDGDGTVQTLTLGTSTWTNQLRLDGLGPLIHQGAGVDDLGRVIVFGGRNMVDPFAPPPDPFVYDLIEGVWYSVAPRGADAQNELFAWCNDDQNRIYTFGGGPGQYASSSTPNSNDAERYIGSQDIWEPIAPMPTAAADATAVYDGNGHILVIGGYDANATTRLSNVAQYDIATNSWSDTAVADLPVGLTGAGAVLGADGRIYVLGGMTGPVNAGTIVDTVYILDQTTNTWSIGPAMPVARMWFSALLDNQQYIYALGGTTPTGGTTRVDKMFTTLCPIFATQPQSVTGWSPQKIVLATSVTGTTPITYQWFKDGVPLTDGSTGTGSTISGALTDTLTITHSSSADSGDYHLLASNDCGQTASNTATVVINTPPTLPTNWQATVMHPSWAINGSSMTGVENGQQVGYGNKPVQDWSAIDRPVLWHGTQSSAIDMTPAGSVGGGIFDTDGTTQVGWWWWPYQCYIGGQWVTCYTAQAARWEGSPGTHTNLQVSGWEYSHGLAVGTQYLGGTVTNDDNSGNTWHHAVMWDKATNLSTDFHPSGVSSSFISYIDGDYQYGSVITNFPFTTHAAQWHGSKDSFVDLNPTGAYRSYLNDAADGQQVGAAEFNGQLYAGIWTGSADSFELFIPDNASASGLAACESGLQIGSFTVNGIVHPAIWAGDPNQYVDLTPFIPSQYTAGVLADLDVQADGTIVIVGQCYNPTQNRYEAVMWTSLDTPPCQADFNGDGQVNTLDVLAFLNAWSSGDASADINNDGQINTLDLLEFLNLWTVGC